MNIIYQLLLKLSHGVMSLPVLPTAVIAVSLPPTTIITTTSLGFFQFDLWTKLK
jgi:hypothetical protein